MRKLLAAGLLAGLVLGCAASPGRAVDQDAIDRAIDRGDRALRALQQRDGTWPHHEIGATALAGLTLLECGAKADDRAVLRAADAVRKASVPLTHNYSICLSILFLDRLGDPEDVPLIESLAVRLLAGQTATGGWGYFSPPVPAAEVRRLNAKLAARKKEAVGEERPRPAAGRRTVKDLPREIQQQLAAIERAGLMPGAGGVMGSDNSNTQFATLALWVARRHGLPVENALRRLEARYRASQNLDGGWGYFERGAMRGPIARSTASMTCAGLLGLAVANGGEAERTQQRRPGQKPAREADKDANLRRGLAALGTVVGQPQGRDGPRVAAAGRLVALGGRTYYFLWSLERVAVALDLKTIGQKDWYGWGAELLVANQQENGLWLGSYAESGADTCFALLFLKRANLARDLTARLTGRVQDPGQRVLREGVAGGERTPGLSSGIESRNARPNTDGRYPDSASPGRRPPPGGAAESEPPGAEPPARGPVATDRPSSSPAARMAADFVKATGSKHALLLKQMQESRGTIFTEALALAIPQLTGERKQKARDALEDRLTRMREETLLSYLDDEKPEIRRAAALAGGTKGSTALVPRLIELLRDPNRDVAAAAHVALKEITRKDFGPADNATAAEREQAVRKWREWSAANPRK